MGIRENDRRSKEAQLAPCLGLSPAVHPGAEAGKAKHKTWNNVFLTWNSGHRVEKPSRFHIRQCQQLFRSCCCEFAMLSTWHGRVGEVIHNMPQMPSAYKMHVFAADGCWGEVYAYFHVLATWR